MARHKLKPNLDTKKEMEDISKEIVEYFGKPYDDRCNYSHDHVSLREISKVFNMSVLKIRKILITAGVYTIEQQRIVDRLHKLGMTAREIADYTNLSVSSVNSYLPYDRGLYKLEEKTVGAERTARWRERKKKSK